MYKYVIYMIVTAQKRRRDWRFIGAKFLYVIKVKLVD